MAPQIRVDQSHCNYQLSAFLQKEGWDVVFRDPGRVSRGLSGNQAAVLGIFERNGWPIPDIAATKDGSVLLIEVDSSLTKNESSLAHYRAHAASIIEEFNTDLPSTAPAAHLLVGFCKVGRSTAQDRTKAEAAGLALLSSFDVPEAPTMLWFNSD